MSDRAGKTTACQVVSVSGQQLDTHDDHLATEEPLEIRIHYGAEMSTAAVTMRTPGNDFELAAGFLFAEGLIDTRDDILDISYCLDDEIEARQRFNIVTVLLRPEAKVDLSPLQRHFIMSSACGVCGKASIEALEARVSICPPSGEPVSAQTISRLPDRIESAQAIFQQTGGLHAAALFDDSGHLLELREDVGRHNALDKLLGWALMSDKLPLDNKILLVSGRASFELVQKCVAGGISIFCAVSAPSSLAVDLAKSFGVTLVGFLRGERFNIYTGHERVRFPEP